MNAARETPLVSVVVPTCDRREAIERCLDALVAQTWPAFEIIVVDDGSRDGTAAFLSERAARHPDLVRVLTNDRNMGANVSRNMGIMASSGAYVAFLDSDCVAEPDWIEELVRGFGDDPRVAAVTGLVLDPEPTNVWELAFRGTHRLARAGRAHRLVAGNLCVRHGPLLEHRFCADGATPPPLESGQPDVRFSGACDEETLALHLRGAGHRLVAHPAAVVLHEHGYDRHSFLRQAWYGGRAAADLVFRYRLPHRLDMLPFMGAWAALAAALAALPVVGPAVFVAPCLLFAAAIGAVAFNELANKGKTIAQLMRAAPALAVYYHVRLAGYVAKTLRLLLRVDRPPRLAEPLPHESLRTADLEHDLGRRSALGGASVMLGQAAIALIGVGGTVVLARLLTPEDFGLVAMTGALLAFIVPLADLGLPQSTIQRKEIRHAQVSAMFWISAAVGAAATIVALLAAWPLGVFYGDRRVTAIVVGLALGFTITGLGAQSEALLKRRMRFGAVSAIGVGSAFAGAAAGVTVAALGGGYWALVAMPLAAALARTALVWLACGWRPSLPAPAAGVGSMMRFGGYLAATGLLGAAVRNVDKVLVGRFIGSAATGFYVNANRLLLMPVSQLNAPLTSVAVPALSRLQGDPERFRRFYRHGVELVGSLSLPAVVAALVTADDLVPAVLGARWAPSVPIFLAFGPAAVLASLNVVTSWVYVPLGRTDRQFRWHAFRAVCLMIGFAVGLRWGAVGVAAALSVVNVTLRLPAVLYCFHGTFLRLADAGAAVWRPVAATAVAAGVTLAIRGGVETGMLHLDLALDLAIYAATLAAAWLSLPGGARRTRVLLDSLREMRRPG